MGFPQSRGNAYVTQQHSLDDLREGRVRFALDLSHERLQDDALEALKYIRDDYVAATTAASR